MDLKHGLHVYLLHVRMGVSLFFFYKIQMRISTPGSDAEACKVVRKRVSSCFSHLLGVLNPACLCGMQ